MIALAACTSVADAGTVPSLKTGVIVDTEVLVDSVFRNRPRHHLALRLFESLRSTDTPVITPAHAVFEYQSAFQQAQRDQAAEVSPEARSRNLSTSVILCPVSIDQALLTAYPRFRLPYLRAGDLTFLALAVVLQRPLVTEDGALFKKASALNLVVTGIEGYLKSVGA